MAEVFEAPRGVTFLLRFMFRSFGGGLGGRPNLTSRVFAAAVSPAQYCGMPGSAVALGLAAERYGAVLPYPLLAQAGLDPARGLAAARRTVIKISGAEQKMVDTAGAVQARRLDLDKSSKSLSKLLAESSGKGGNGNGSYIATVGTSKSRDRPAGSDRDPGTDEAEL